MRNIRSTARCSLFALTLIATGCAGYWGRRSIDQPTAVEPRAPVWIWSGGEVLKWHAVFVTRDSVSGIPYDEFVYCRSCRLTIPLTRVDSMKVASRTLPQNVTEALGIVTVALLADILVEAAWCTLLGLGFDRCHD
jgi:hypothetical protein